MTIASCICTSFRMEMLRGEHDLESDTLKVALFNASASLGLDTTAYSTSNEIVQSGYTAGGKTLANVAVSEDDGVVLVDFDDVTWTSVTFETDPPRGALIYNASASNKAIAVINFGADQYVNASDFVLQLPPANAQNALLKFISGS